MENIVTGNELPDPRGVVIPGRPVPAPAINWGDPLPADPTDPIPQATDLAQTAQAAQQIDELHGLNPAGEPSAPEAPPNVFALPNAPVINNWENYSNPNVQPVPYNNPNFVAEQNAVQNQQAALNALPKVYQAGGFTQVPQPDLQAMYGTSATQMFGQSNAAGLAFQRQQESLRRPATTVPPTTLNSDPRTPQSTRNIFNGSFGGNTGQSSNAWQNVGQEIGQSWDLIRGFVGDLFHNATHPQEVGNLVTAAQRFIQSPNVQGVGAAISTVAPQAAQAGTPFLQSLAPEVNASGQATFDPGRGYFGEMGSGLRGAALYGLSLPGQLTAASIYSITDLGRYLVGGEDNLPGQIDDYRHQGLRYAQALTGQDLGFTNVRDPNSNRYLAAIDPNAPVWLQWAEGLGGFVGDTIGLGWVDDALGEVARTGRAALPTSVPDFSFRHGLTTVGETNERRAAQEALQHVQTATPGQSTPTELQTVVQPPSSLSAPSEAVLPQAPANDPIPLVQVSQSLDPATPTPQRVFRTNTELTQIAQAEGITPVNGDVLTNNEVSQLQHTFTDNTFNRYGTPVTTETSPIPLPPGGRPVTVLADETKVHVNYSETPSESPFVRRGRGRPSYMDTINAAKLEPEPPVSQWIENAAPTSVVHAEEPIIQQYLQTTDDLVVSGRAEGQVSSELVELQQQMKAHIEELQQLPLTGRNYIADEQGAADLYSRQKGMAESPPNELNHPLLRYNPQDDTHSFFQTPNDNVHGTLEQMTPGGNEYNVAFDIGGESKRANVDGAPPYADLKALANRFDQFVEHPATKGLRLTAEADADNAAEYLAKVKWYTQHKFDILDSEHNKISLDELKNLVDEHGFEGVKGHYYLEYPQAKIAENTNYQTFYHGSKQTNIERISPDLGGSSNELGSGLYLTRSKREAELYAKAGSNRTQLTHATTNRAERGIVHEVQAAITKPIDATAKPPRTVRDMMTKAASDVWGAEFGKHYAEAIKGNTLENNWLAARDTWGKVFPTRPMSEMKYQQFQRQVAEGLRRRGYDSIEQPSRGVTVLLDQGTGRMPLNTISKTEVGVGNAVESARARRLIDQQLHDYYKGNTTEVFALQSRVALESQMVDDLVKAYEDSLQRGEAAAENFLKAEEAAKVQSKAVRDEVVQIAQRDAMTDMEEQVKTVDVGSDSPCP